MLNKAIITKQLSELTEIRESTLQDYNRIKEEYTKAKFGLDSREKAKYGELFLILEDELDDLQNLIDECRFSLANPK